MKLYERWRPKCFADVVGQDAAISEIEAILDEEGWGGQAWYIQGKSGTGKTSLAYIIASMEAQPCQVAEIPAEDVTINTVREIADSARYVQLYGQSAWIINEAHKLSQRVVTAFLDCLEALGRAERGCVIFTTTNEGADLFGDKFDSGPFRSRCNSIATTDQRFAPAIERHLLHVAEAEGIPLDAAAAKRIQKANGCNMRDNLQALAKYSRRAKLAAVA